MYTSNLPENMANKVLVIVTLVFITNGYISSASIIRVGAIFEGASIEQELVFQVAIDSINKKQLLPRHTMKPLSAHIESDDVINAKQGVVIDVTWDKPFAALEAACSILKQGVVSIFNLLSEDNSNTIQSLCDTKEIPVIQTMLDTKHEKECCSINLFPHLPVLAKAFADVVKHWNWRNFTILYENNQSLLKIAEYLKIYDVINHHVIIRQLKLNENLDYMDTLKNIRNSGHTNFVLDCSIRNLNKILKEAQQVGLLTSEHSYIIINLDMHTIDLSPYQHSETNITGFRLVDPLNPAVIDVAEALQIKRKEFHLDGGLEMENPHIAAWKMQTSELLLVDAVTLFAEVLKDHEYFRPKRLFCNSSDSWEHGSTIFNFMKTKIFNGLTGTIQFDQRGFRTDISLDIIELTEGGIIKVGTWSSKNGLEITGKPPPSQEEHIQKESLSNLTFNIAICWVEPYVMFKNISAQLTGNDQYEGYGVDLIHELSLLEGFNYKFIRNEDDMNGNFNSKTGKWDGVIGDVLNGKADLAISDLTITRERERFVDFTSPFMSLGVQILYKKPSKSPPGFFSFAAPFASDVWVAMGVTFFGMSFVFYLIARICPAEWFNPYPCLEEPRYFVTQYDIENCFWLITANLMQSGPDTAPRGVSTRVLTSFWAFFVLIMLSTYTANMAAFLTAEKDQWHFTSAKQMVNRASKLHIKFGAVENGATHKLFKESDDELFKTIAAYMETHPENMESYFMDGVKRVEEKNTNYAFFMESSSIKYVTERKCNLTGVGPFLDQKFYGIAMRPYSPYRSILSAAILKLQESGKLDELERKWWQKERGGGECVGPPFESAPPLYYQHVSGIIWISCVGILLACGLVFIELMCDICKKIKNNRQRIHKFINELKFYFKFESMIKPVENNLQESKKNES